MYFKVSCYCRNIKETKNHCTIKFQEKRSARNNELYKKVNN